MCLFPNAISKADSCLNIVFAFAVQTMDHAELIASGVRYGCNLLSLLCMCARALFSFIHSCITSKCGSWSLPRRQQDDFSNHDGDDDEDDDKCEASGRKVVHTIK